MGGARVPQVPGGTAAASLLHPLKGEIGLQRGKLQMIKFFFNFFLFIFITFFVCCSTLHIFYIDEWNSIYIYIYIYTRKNKAEPEGIFIIIIISN